MTGLFFKLTARRPGDKIWTTIGAEPGYGRAITTARHVAATHGLDIEVWATDNGARGVPVNLVYRAGAGQPHHPDGT